MASRLIPILVATISGIAIGVATFDGELKEQRKKRLEEEYQRDLAAAAARGQDVSALLKPKNQIENSQPVPEDTQPSALSSALGLWAWKKGGSDSTTTKPAQQASNEPKQ